MDALAASAPRRGCGTSGETSPPYWAISRMKRLLMYTRCRRAGQVHGADAGDGVVRVGHLLLDLEVAAGAQALDDEGGSDLAGGVDGEAAERRRP